MFQIIQEAALPKLSTTSLYTKFDHSSGITTNVVKELKNINNTRVDPNKLTDIMALIKLNGDSIAKKAVNAFIKGQIIILFNTDKTSIPQALPYIIIQNKKGEYNAFIFANTIVNDIHSSNEYRNLMACLEAAYLSLRLLQKPNTFVMNRQLVLTLCNIYAMMVISPLEQKLYMKGENLTKAMLYVVSYFYKMIDGDKISVSTIPFKRIFSDKIDIDVAKQIVEEVKQMTDMSFMSIINMITKINPVRYKDLPVIYLNHFSQVCGNTVIFALENLQYLFLLVASAEYKTNVTGYGLNKSITLSSRKAVGILSSLGLE